MQLFVVEVDLDQFTVNSIESEKVFNSLKLDWTPDNCYKIHRPFYSAICKQREIKKEINARRVHHYCNMYGLIIVADLYLTNADMLKSQLGMKNQECDAGIVLKSYMRWGAECTKYIQGDFLISIWNENKKELFIAIDHNGHRPCFIKHTNNKLVISNVFSLLTYNRKELSINKDCFEIFAVNGNLQNKTCYKEIFKLPAAHHLSFNKKGLSIEKYWTLEKERRLFKKKKRVDYYVEFKNAFAESVKSGLQSQHSICSQLSGGLDSSSVTSIAAQNIKNNDQNLHAFTLIPNKLFGKSYRDLWLYNEKNLANKIIQKYPYITHKIFSSDLDEDIFSVLSNYYHNFDQPIRNIMNVGWGIESQVYARRQNCRILLNGAGGNGTISWRGATRLELLKKIIRRAHLSLKFQKEIKKVFYTLNTNFLLEKRTITNIRNSMPKFNTHKQLLLAPFRSPRYSNTRAIQLQTGVQYFDPTTTKSIIELCYSMPQRVYRRGSQPENMRLLARDSMVGIVPDEILRNINRGEQGVDWYLQYNHKVSNWKEKLFYLPSSVGDIIWSIYDKNKIFNLFSMYPCLNNVTAENTAFVRCQLLRCLSASFFCEYLVSK